MKRILTIALLVFSFYSVSAQENDPKLLSIVEKLEDKMTRLVMGRDLDNMVTMYAENAQYLPDQGRIYTGREEIKRVWQMVFQVEFLDFALNVDRVGGTTDRIYESGTGFSKVKYNGQENLSKFKYVNIWERQTDGSYKLVIDIYNRDIASQ